MVPSVIVQHLAHLHNMNNSKLIHFVRYAHRIVNHHKLDHTGKGHRRLWEALRSYNFVWEKSFIKSRHLRPYMVGWQAYRQVSTRTANTCDFCIYSYTREFEFELTWVVIVLGGGEEGEAEKIIGYQFSTVRTSGGVCGNISTKLQAGSVPCDQSLLPTRPHH